MKKTLKRLLIICSLTICLICCFAIGACECKHVYDNACDEVCNQCKAERTISHDWKQVSCETAKTCKVCSVTEGEALGHEYTVLDSDLTHHWYNCYYCEQPDGNKKEHSGGEVTCSGQALCDVCVQPYGEIDKDRHACGEVHYVWNKDYTTCTATVLCKYDKSHVLATEEGSISILFTGNCLIGGTYVYVANFSDSKIFPAHSSEVLEYEAGGEIGHVYTSDCDEHCSASTYFEGKTIYCSQQRRSEVDHVMSEDGNYCLNGTCDYHQAAAAAGKKK